MTCPEFRKVWSQQETSERNKMAAKLVAHLQTCDECPRWIKEEDRCDVYFLDWIRQFLPKEALPHLKTPRVLS